MTARSMTLRSSLLLVTGVLLLSREAIFYCAFYILGSSIDWPGSLGLPATEALPLIASNQTAVFAGYYLYMFASLLFVAVAMALRSAFANDDPLVNLMLDIAVGFAIVSASMRALGILRWLFAMPALAETYFNSMDSDVLIDMVTSNFDLLNNYAGQAGEHLGVQLTGAMFLGAAALAFVRHPAVPKAFSIWLIISAMLFIPWPTFFGFDGGAVFLTLNGMTYSLWAMAFGVYLIRVARRTRIQPLPA